MSNISSLFGHLPGMGSVVETFEAAIPWGPYPRYFTGAYIDASAVDSGNTPTSTLRMGLVMGKVTATGTWKNYSPTATDGSEVAQGVLPVMFRMTDVLTLTTQAKFWGVMVSGGVKAANLLGLDLMARAQMANRFYFDDNLTGNIQFPFQRFQTKTTSYTIVATDNLSVFDNLGAVGAVTFTLPAIANGYYFGFRVMAGQNVIVASAEGDNMIVFNDAAADSVAFQTGGQLIGGGFHIYSNSAGTAWIVENASAGTNTITVVT